MKNAKSILIWVLLVVVVGLIGCGGGGSNSGGSSPTPTPPANPLVGTWRDATGATPSLTFKADGTGYLSDGVHDITDWSLSSSNVLSLKLNGTPETFKLTWTNAAQTTMSLENIGPNSNETTNYIKT